MESLVSKNQSQGTDLKHSDYIKLKSQLDEMHRIMMQLQLGSKEYYSVDEVAWYLGCSKQHVYVLTSKGALPIYCPSGKIIYIKKADLINYIETSKSGVSNVEKKAANYLVKN